MTKLDVKCRTREDLLATVKAEAEKREGSRLGIAQFEAATGWRKHEVEKFFPSWNEALKAAGVVFDAWGESIESDRLLEDWGRVARKVGCVPRLRTYKIEGKYYRGTLAKRFGKWSKVDEAFMNFAKGKREWADVVKLIRSGSLESRRQSEQIKRRKSEVSGKKKERKWVTARRRRNGMRFGPPLQFPMMRNEPMNECGVVLLFGALAERLGFCVEAVRLAYPDCFAKREVRPGEWENVRIEFEFESRNFRDHGHPPDGCDIIICWKHNWPDCPAHIEVIELSEVIKRLGAT